MGVKRKRQCIIDSSDIGSREEQECLDQCLEVHRCHLVMVKETVKCLAGTFNLADAGIGSYFPGTDFDQGQA